MIRTLKEATVRTYQYEAYRQLGYHIADYLAAYNFAEHLKALRWETPYETIRALWESNPELFRVSPDHFTLGPQQLNSAMTEGNEPVIAYPAVPPQGPIGPNDRGSTTGVVPPETFSRDYVSGLDSERLLRKSSSGAAPAGMLLSSKATS